MGCVRLTDKPESTNQRPTHPPQVHNAFGPDGHIWERVLSLVSAPVLALSATIASPAAFGGWLQGLEARRGRPTMPECIVSLRDRRERGGGGEP